MVGFVLLAALAVGYPIVESSVGAPITVFALPAMLVAVVAGTRTIVLVGAASLCVAAAEGALTDRFTAIELAARLAVMVLAMGFALAGARLRIERQEEARRMANDHEALRDQLASLTKALHAGPMGGWRWDRATGAVAWDPDLERLHGLEPGSFGGTLESWLDRLPPELRDEWKAGFDSALAARSSFSFEYSCVWPDGSTHWVRGLGEPTIEDAGRVSGMLGVTVGIDERHAADEIQRRTLELERRNRARADSLHRATQAIGSSLEFDQLVDNITAAAVPGLADWCRLTLLINDAGSRIAKIATNHPDPTLAATLAVYHDANPFDGDSDESAAKVIRFGTTVHSASIDDDMIDEVVADDERRELARRLDVRSVIIVPLKGPLGVVGALQLYRTSTSPRYTEQDVALAEELAITIGYALTNSLHFDRQRSARRALDILQRLTGRLAVAVTVEDVVREVIVHGTSGLGADGGLLYLLDSEERLTLAYQTGYDPEQIAPWTVMEPGDHLPLAHAVQRNRPVVLRNAAEMAEHYPFYAANPVRDAAVVAFPLQIRRVRTGAMMFSFTEPHDFSQDELTMLETLAGRCAGALERAELYERQREASLTLQRRMLPGLPTLPPRLEAAAHYQPASGGEVGGDWYHLFEVSGGCWSAVLGDAVGRGIPAAAAMGQLRGVITGAASVDPEPARVIAASDAFAAIGEDTRAASLAYALIDLDNQEIRYGSAGHLPALVLRNDGTVEMLLEGRGALLGVLAEPSAIVAGRTSFRPGDVLVMYSDGLIERRAESIDAGLSRIQRSLEALHTVEPRELCPRLVQALVGEELIDDDVAVLVVRRVS